VFREHGVSSATFYKWKTTDGGMDLSQALNLDARFSLVAFLDDERFPDPVLGSKFDMELRHSRLSHDRARAACGMDSPTED
jgi:hypothetical protein